MRRVDSETPSIELHRIPEMGLFRSRRDYQPVRGDADIDAERDDESIQQESETGLAVEAPFSWIEYAIFLLLGIAMLWAWCVQRLI
jgi:hypothetical protein